EQLADSEGIAELADTGACLTWVDLPEPRVDLEVAPPGQRAVDDRLLKDDRARRTCCERRLGHIEARDRRGASAGKHRRSQHSDRVRLAGAVGAEKADALARRNVEIASFHRLDAARKRLPEPSRSNHRFHQSLLSGSHIDRRSFVNEMTERRTE